MASATEESIEMLLQLTATDLIWLGETADGKRGVDLVLVKDCHGKPRLKEAVEDGDTKVRDIKIKTEPSRFKAGRKREQIKEVLCRPHQGKEFLLTSKAEFDAVFWSESAIGKFVWPYYHSHRLWDSVMQGVREAFDGDPHAVAIAHQAPSKSSVQPPSLGSLHVGRVTTINMVPELEFVPAAQYLEEAQSSH
jgi:hypothetical protein